MKTIETYYLIDFDNVSSSGLSGWDNLDSNAHIVIFHASNTKTMKIDIDMLAIGKHVNLEINKIPQGNQSVDKHIISYTGYLIGAKGNNCQIVIISGDKGYENIIKFWTDRGAKNISCAGQIGKLAKKAAPTPKKPTAKAKKADLNTRLNEAIMQAVKGAKMNGSIANKVTPAVIKLHKNNQLNEANIMKELRKIDHNAYQNIYNAIVPVLRQHCGCAANTPPKDNPTIEGKLKEAGCPGDVIKYILSVWEKHKNKEDSKKNIHNELVSKCGQKKGRAYYNTIKKLLK